MHLLCDCEWNWKPFISSAPMPNILCEHRAREDVFYTVLRGSYECFKLWMVAQSTNNWSHPPEDLLDEMRSQPARLQWVRNLSLIFEGQSMKCKECLLQAGDDDSSYNDVLLQGLKVRDISPPSPQMRRPPLPDPLALEDDALSMEWPANEDGMLTDFDDYGSAPLRGQQTPVVLNTWTFDSSGLLALPNWASTWKDHGYRLPPNFERVSSKERATDYASRLLPTVDDRNANNDVEALPSTPSSETHSLMEVDPPQKRKPISMGASAMLDEAGRATKRKESYNVFVRGKTRADDFIELDLEQDHVPLTREHVDISVDIDSVLWVTSWRGLSCKGAINLHLNPHFAAQPPFSANPCIYVTLLQPPCDEDELKCPQSRTKSRFSLSSIPHMPFGYFGEGTQQFNLYVFFPRMVHKNVHNNRAITIMPTELQELWLSEAVFKGLEPSMANYTGTSEYLPHSLEQLKGKAGGRSRQPTLPISPPAIMSLLANIRQQVSDNGDLLSRFGSFFFVLDARGIKLLTKQHMPGENALQTLRKLVPSMDWAYMMDPKNGELYLDLGVSFHPKNTSEPMVGLWRLGSLRRSYALMGYSSRNCEEYSHNTMRDYGGIKAEMSDSTKHHTHIVKRISYNLHFEAIRQPGERAYISTVDDMIRCNQKYVDGCKHWVKVFEDAEKNSYGVRDELRAGAHVVAELLPKVMQRVCLDSFFHLHWYVC